MQALGLIETIGLIAAIESADAMLKAADVNLLEKTYVGGGLVSIAVTGDVGAVKAAIEAGATAVNMIESTLLVSQHVIPRPHEDLNEVISVVPLKDKDVTEADFEKIRPEEVIAEVAEEDTNEITEEVPIEVIDEDTAEVPVEFEETVVEDLTIENTDVKESQIERSDASLEIDLNKLNNKKAVDDIVLQYGLEKAIEVLSKFKVVELRNLARNYKNFGIKGRSISKAGKNLLLREFREYYGRNQ